VLSLGYDPVLGFRYRFADGRGDTGGEHGRLHAQRHVRCHRPVPGHAARGTTVAVSVRPPIGPTVKAALPAWLVEWLTAEAERRGIDRAAVVREWLLERQATEVRSRVCGS
jgi:hypothetical protein